VRYRLRGVWVDSYVQFDGEPIHSFRCRHHARAIDHMKFSGGTMLYYAVMFFVIALIAAVLGFGGLAAGAAGIAKILFFVFLVIAVATFTMSLMRKRT
jgi:uncharacterized membrane protein YtjA (UPF0391 family)